MLCEDVGESGRRKGEGDSLCVSLVSESACLPAISTIPFINSTDSVLNCPLFIFHFPFSITHPLSSRG
jgi:hypothetical protein